VILTPDFYKKLPETTEEENDMLDLAAGLTDTSRLGCQIILKKELAGMEIQLPAVTKNQQAEALKKASVSGDKDVLRNRYQSQSSVVSGELGRVDGRFFGGRYAEMDCRTTDDQQSHKK